MARHLGGGVRLYWASRRRWPRAKIAPRHAARIVRLGIVLVEADVVSCGTTGSTASRPPVWLSATAALVEAGGVSCGTTGSTASRPPVWLSATDALVAMDVVSCGTTGSTVSRSPVWLSGTGELGARGCAMRTTCHARS